jgi:hypothetical protein
LSGNAWLLASLVFVSFTVNAADRGVRFDSPGVLDLAQRSLRLNNAVSMTVLDAQDQKRILAEPTLDEAHATLEFSQDLFGCKAEDDKACLRKHEQSLSPSAVVRSGRKLTVSTADGARSVFVDWSMPESKTADGDAETHWYLGTLTGSGYHRVEVQFGHDSPGSFLVNPQSGKIAFVHNGSDIVALAPDGKHLLTFNAENPPLSLRVAALDATGPRLVLECSAAAHDDKTAARFKGWRDAQTFDSVLTGGSASIALRAHSAGDTWNLVSDPQGLAALGFTCHQ